MVPVYGANQFDEHTRRRISYYEFTNVFYLPAQRTPAFDEGFARLDHVQSVVRGSFDQPPGDEALLGLARRSDRVVRGVHDWPPRCRLPDPWLPHPDAQVARRVDRTRPSCEAAIDIGSTSPTTSPALASQSAEHQIVALTEAHSVPQAGVVVAMPRDRVSRESRTYRDVPPPRVGSAFLRSPAIVGVAGMKDGGLVSCAQQHRECSLK